MQTQSTLSEEANCLIEYQQSIELFGSITGLCFNEILEKKNTTGTYAVSERANRESGIEIPQTQKTTLMQTKGNDFPC